MKKTPAIGIVLFVVQFSMGYAQTDLDALSLKYARQSLPAFKELLSLPNDAHFPADILQNVQWCEQAFQQRGFATQRLETTTVPLLLATRPSLVETEKTVLAYLQIDGQPVDPSFWFQESPWKPVLKKEVPGEGWVEIPWESLEKDWDPEWRIFARSTSDAKGPAVAFLAALDALAETNTAIPYHLKVIMDFEEELGSPRLPAAVQAYREALKADVLVIFDGPNHVSNEPTLSFGARGIADVTITVYGPYFPQHSGHYGNYCPNPALQLAQLLASMKDEQGRVTIPGFYEGIALDEPTRNILASVPDDERYIQSKLGIAQPDQVAANLQEALQYPSLNIRGMQSGWIGEEARTIIPATATAEIDVRLVMESDPERLIQLIRDHVQAQGFTVLDHAPNALERNQYAKICRFDYSVSYKAFRTELDSEAGLWLSKAMHKAFGKEPIKIRTAGGSIPISPFVTALDIPAVAVPTVNPDNNQHSPNENIRLGNYQDAIKAMIVILSEAMK
ncbi:MAG TPA: M20/M25/M40 family metallo-hydrolase [Saprospiraceae bacterium]|nr:M20/M25/M40 family metallo-hydrolase [Saprospiraceae bacterium]HMQ83866.1 M20/M25/M40 family metallo-hydrolase [Saprospiraceae bacterium]